MDRENKYGILKSGLAVDIDETLSWTIGHWVEQMMAMFGNPEHLSVKEIIEKYRYTQHVPYWQTPEALAWVRQNINSNEIQKELPLISGANLYLQKINEIIPIAAYLTIRPETVREGTEHWLRKHDFPSAPIIHKQKEVAHQDGNKWKAAVLQELYPEIVGIIDDNAKLLDFLSVDYPGKVFLYDHRDNLGRTNAMACPDWPTVYKETKDYFKNWK